MNARGVVIALLLVAAGLGRSYLEAIPPADAQSLERLPLTIGEWVGEPGPSFDPEVLGVLRADDHVNRVYYSDAVAALFVGYYRSQRFGATMHSPLNCLPGAGWQPVRAERLALGTSGTANQVLIQKGEERQIVVYWYQSATRVEGSEYWSKIHLVTDAVTTRRNDAALVRVIAPVDPDRADGEAHAARTAFRLAALVQPRVAALLFRPMPDRQS